MRDALAGAVALFLAFLVGAILMGFTVGGFKGCDGSPPSVSRPLRP